LCHKVKALAAQESRRENVVTKKVWPSSSLQLYERAAELRDAIKQLRTQPP
jgi:protein-arginine kinase activator protein McsA